MAFQLTDFGITAIATALVNRFRLRKTVEVGTPVIKSTGLFHTNEAFDPTFEFSAEGSGDLPSDFALGSTELAIDGVTGGQSFINSTDERKQVGQEESWEASGMNFPSATAPGA